MSSVDIHRKPNGRCEVRWREGGRRRGRTFDRKADATDFRDYVRGRIQRAGIPDLNAGRQPLWQFMEEWWRLYAIPNLAPATRDVYIRLWEKHLEPRVGTCRLRELTPAVIADLRVQLEREVGAPTVIKALAILQAVCKQAVIHGRMELNPVAVIDKPRQRPSEASPPLTPATIEAIRAQLDPFDATLVSVLAYAGLRPQEAIALDWRHVSTKRVRVWAPKTQTTRSVDLLEPLADDCCAGDVKPPPSAPCSPAPPARRGPTTTGGTGAAASTSRRPQKPASSATCGPTASAAASSRCSSGRAARSPTSPPRPDTRCRPSRATTRASWPSSRTGRSGSLRRTRSTPGGDLLDAHWTRWTRRTPPKAVN